MLQLNGTSGFGGCISVGAASNGDPEVKETAGDKFWLLLYAAVIWGSMFLAAAFIFANQLLRGDLSTTEGGDSQ